MKKPIHLRAHYLLSNAAHYICYLGPRILIYERRTGQRVNISWKLLQRITRKVTEMTGKQ